MLNCIDGAGKGGDGVFVVGECLDVSQLDDALVRGGRMEGRIEMGEVGEGWREIVEGEFEDWNLGKERSEGRTGGATTVYYYSKTLYNTAQ